MLSFGIHLLYHHFVKTLELCTFDDINHCGHIVTRRRITALLDTCSPTFIVIWRQISDILLVSLCHEYLGMVFIALPNIVILLKLLIWLVIVSQDIVPIICSLYAEMIVGSVCQCTFAIGRLDDALGKSYGCRYAISPHLLHSILCIPFYVLLS